MEQESATDFVWDYFFMDGSFYWTREDLYERLDLIARYSIEDLKEAVTEKQKAWSDGGYAFIQFVMDRVDWQVIKDRLEAKLKENEDVSSD